MTTTRAAPRRRAIDPRVRERRVAVLRARGRRRLRALLVLVGFGIVLVAGWLVVESPLLDVDQVLVAGANRTDADDLRRAAGIDRGSPIVFVDTDGTRSRLEALPWVAGASVVRSWPDEVRITVTEREPTSFARAPNGVTLLLDASGRVLARGEPVPAGLPELIGLTGFPGAGEWITPRRAARVVTQLPEALRSRLAAVVIGGDQATLRLLDGPEIRLGPMIEIEAKAAAAIAVLGALDRPVAYIDVRVPSAPAAG